LEEKRAANGKVPPTEIIVNNPKKKKLIPQHASLLPQSYKQIKELPTLSRRNLHQKKGW